MSLKPYRCTNEACSDQPGGNPQHDFVAESDSPVCPKCGADARTEEGSHVVYPLAILHYLYVNPAGSLRTGAGRRSVACQPDAVRIPVSRVQMHKGGSPQPQACATGEPASVTCPACKATDVWKSHMETGDTQHVEIIKTQVPNRTS